MALVLLGSGALEQFGRSAPELAAFLRYHERAQEYKLAEQFRFDSYVMIMLEDGPETQQILQTQSLRVLT